MISFFAALAALGGLFLSGNIKNVDTILKPLSRPLLGSTNILLLGVDGGAQDKINRADSIAVININPLTKHVGILAIPRDCRMPVPGYGQTKINHAYAYGGQRLIREALANYLQIQIPYFVEIDMTGAEILINQIGGVSINVEKRMYYVDRAGGLYIDLYPGYQLLDGQRALHYARFRNDAWGDLGRIERQQKLIMAIADKLTKVSVIFKAPTTIHTMSRYTKTNVPPSIMFDLMLNLRDSHQLGRLDIATIPSTPVYINGISYMQPDWNRVQALVRRVIHGPGLSVEVLNGTGKTGLGRNVSNQLTQLGYHVPATNDASRTDYKETVLINWHGERQGKEALALAQKLNIKQSNILVRKQEDTWINFSLIIGHDWPLGR